VELVMFISQDT